MTDREALRISRDQSARSPAISTPPRTLARNSPAHSMPTGAGTVSCVSVARGYQKLLGCCLSYVMSECCALLVCKQQPVGRVQGFCHLLHQIDLMNAHHSEE